MVLQEPHKIGVHDALDIRLPVASPGEELRNVRQVRNGIEVARRLFATECAVQVRANADMGGVSRELADMVDVIDHALEPQGGGLGSRFAAYPAGNKHPGVERHSNDRAARNQRFNLFVAKLSHVGHQRAAVLMTRPNGAAKKSECLPKTLVVEMCDIENQPKPRDFFQQFASFRIESARGIGAIGVDSWSIMSGADGSQALRMEAFEVLRGDEGVSTFEAEDVADG